MRLPLPTQRLVPVILLVALAAAFIAVAAGRVGGGGGGGGTAGASPNQIVERAFTTGQVKSGKFDASVNVSLNGAPTPQLSNLRVDVTGAFENDPKPPKVQFDMSVSGPTSFKLGVLSTGKQAFLKIGNSAYGVPRQQVERLAAQSPGNQSLSAFGIDPHAWLQNPTNAGTAKIGGVETNHVTAQLNTSRMLDDLAKLSSVSGRGGNQPSESELNQAKKALKDARVDLYAAKSDGSLRKMSGQVAVEAPKQKVGGVRLGGGSGTISFDMQLSELNKPQTFTAPHDVKPIDRFQGDLTAQVLSRIGRGSTPAGSGSPATPGGSKPGGTQTAPAPSLPGPAEAYLKCVEKASTSAAIQQCAPLLD